MSNDPTFQQPYQASTFSGQTPVALPVAATAGDATGGVIPYKNMPALLAYYLGLFSLIPVVGLLLAVPAFILGIIGLRKRARNPAVKGSIHAWIGIVMGGLFTIAWGGLLVIAVLAS